MSIHLSVINRFTVVRSPVAVRSVAGIAFVVCTREGTPCDDRVALAIMLHHDTPIITLHYVMLRNVVITTNGVIGQHENTHTHTHTLCFAINHNVLFRSFRRFKCFQSSKQTRSDQIRSKVPSKVFKLSDFSFRVRSFVFAHTPVRPGRPSM